MLNPEDILRIRSSRESLTKLAEYYHVSRTAIANIKNGRTYKDPTSCPTCKRPYREEHTHAEATEERPEI